jgi:hypothetical protein
MSEKNGKEKEEKANERESVISLCFQTPPTRTLFFCPCFSLVAEKKELSNYSIHILLTSFDLHFLFERKMKIMHPVPPCMESKRPLPYS